MKVRVQLNIDHLESSMETGLQEHHPFMVKIGWVGSRMKMIYLYKNVKENRTSAKPVQANGVVRWNEEFDHVVKLKKIKPEGYKSWFLYLQVQEVKNDSRPTLLVATKAKIDITEDLTMGTARSIRIPIECKIRGVPVTVNLKVAIKITERQAELARSKFSFKRATSSLLFSCSGVDSCVPSIHNARTLRERRYSTSNREDSSRRARNLSIDCSSSEGEPEPSYKNLQLCNFLINQLEYKEDQTDDDESMPMYGTRLSLSPDLSPKENQEEQNHSPITRLFSRVLSSKKDEQPKSVPLLNKSCSDIGGDDIDIQRHNESNTCGISGNPRSNKVHPEEVLRISGFNDDEPFEIGNWERRSVLSRDGELELVTDVFLATIDQRSEKASGGSACTVLAVVIADWLHRNQGDLPLRCQLDQLVREGSLIWRDLCKNENLRERFTDHHFDLETVLKEEIRPLIEVVDLSYVGFLGMDELQEHAEFLQGAMCFDCIWDQILRDGTNMENQVYICSWNDHFFVVKIERDAIYLIDTFGERLFEGCNQGYILKFHKDSVIYRYKSVPSSHADNKQSVVSSQVSTKEGNCNTQENGYPKEVSCEEKEPSSDKNMENQDHDKIKNYLAKEAACNGKQSPKEVTSSSEEIASEEIKASSNEKTEKSQEERKEMRCRETISEGMNSCREYIKGFLASLPVRQLKMEMKTGPICENTVHTRLQIEFHYIAPRDMDCHISC